MKTWKGLGEECPILNGHNFKPPWARTIFLARCSHKKKRLSSFGQDYPWLETYAWSKHCRGHPHPHSLALCTLSGPGSGWKPARLRWNTGQTAQKRMLPEKPSTMDSWELVDTEFGLLGPQWDKSRACSTRPLRCRQWKWVPVAYRDDTLSSDWLPCLTSPSPHRPSWNLHPHKLLTPRFQSWGLFGVAQPNSISESSEV